MTIYELLLVLHIAAAIVWLGAATTMTLLALGAQRSSDPGALAVINSHNDYLATRLFIPASMSTLIFGLLLVAEGSWNLDQLWLIIGLAGFLVSFFVGVLYFKPEGERIGELAERHGPTHPEVIARMEKMEAVGRAELAVLFVVVADMVVKPTGDDTAVLITGAALLAAVTAAVFAGSRRSAAA